MRKLLNRFPLYVLVIAMILSFSGCAVPMIGMTDETCDSMRYICHRGRTVGQYMADAVSIQRCGSGAYSREGSHYKPWDSECRDSANPQLQPRSGVIWNPSRDAMQYNDQQREKQIVLDRLRWCRGAGFYDSPANRATCMETERDLMAGRYRPLGIVVQQ